MNKESKAMQKEIFDYLDSVLTIRDGHIVVINDNPDIAYQLIIGGICQVINSAFGILVINYTLPRKWYRKKLKELK